MSKGTPTGAELVRKHGGDWTSLENAIDTALAAAREAQAEADAKIAEAHLNTEDDCHGGTDCYRHIAAAIRATVHQTGERERRMQEEGITEEGH